MKKYKHTKQDQINDANFIQDFSMEFLNRFNIKHDNVHELNVMQSYLGYGASSTFFLDQISFKSKNLIINNKPFIHISTQINPNGIDSTGKIGRTFTIKFELKCKEKAKFQREFSEGIYMKFYDYSENMNEVLDKFENFMLKKYAPTLNKLID